MLDSDFKGGTTMTDATTNYTWSDGEILDALLYDLAQALGYKADVNGGITCDPGKVVDEALETIWKYRELQD